MQSWKAKFIGLFMIFLLFFSTSATSAHAYSVIETPPEKVPFSDPANLGIYYAHLVYFTNYSMADKETQLGLRSIVVKESCEFVAWLIRKGVTNDTVMEIVTEHFDKAAADALKKNTYKIANELDRLAKLPDVTTLIIKEKIYYFMADVLKINGGSAKVIAEGIAAGINFLVF